MLQSCAAKLTWILSMKQTRAFEGWLQMAWCSDSMSLYIFWLYLGKLACLAQISIATTVQAHSCYHLSGSQRVSFAARDWPCHVHLRL